MSAKVIVVMGTQWGDEGKGRVTDYLAQYADMGIRYSGGNNAGHSVVVNELGKFKLHIIPVSILNPDAVSIIGTGTVVDLPTLALELFELEERGIAIHNLFISRKAHLVMPWHIMQDEAEELSRNPDEKIGTTKRGMGPVSEDKAGRHGLRAQDLLDIDKFRKRFEEIYQNKRHFLRDIGYPADKLPMASHLFDEYAVNIPKIIDFISDTERLVWRMLEQENRTILLEGAQAVLLGIDHGTYPYVTSSNGGAAQASEGSGIPISKITERIGVVKAYPTRVGAGPFPTRMHPRTDNRLRELGKEYGATTGRPRICGWLDLPLLRYAHELNDFTSLAVTKLDILSDFSALLVGIGYECSLHKNCTDPTCGLNGASARYKQIAGWREDITGIRRREDLPRRAQAYIEMIEEYVGVPVKFISVGPERGQAIIC